MTQRWQPRPTPPHALLICPSCPPAWTEYWCAHTLVWVCCPFLFPCVSAHLLTLTHALTPNAHLHAIFPHVPTRLPTPPRMHVVWHALTRPPLVPHVKAPSHLSACTHTRTCPPAFPAPARMHPLCMA